MATIDRQVYIRQPLFWVPPATRFHDEHGDIQWPATLVDDESRTGRAGANNMTVWHFLRARYTPRTGLLYLFLSLEEKRNEPYSEYIMPMDNASTVGWYGVTWNPTNLGDDGVKYPLWRPAFVQSVQTDFSNPGPGSVVLRIQQKAGSSLRIFEASFSELEVIEVDTTSGTKIGLTPQQIRTLLPAEGQTGHFVVLQLGGLDSQNRETLPAWLQNVRSLPQFGGGTAWSFNIWERHGPFFATEHLIDFRARIASGAPSSDYSLFEIDVGDTYFDRRMLRYGAAVVDVGLNPELVVQPEVLPILQTTMNGLDRMQVLTLRR